MIDLEKLRKFIAEKSTFAEEDVFVGKYYDNKSEILLLTFLNSNKHEITFNNNTNYGELTLSIKYNGSQNYKTSFDKANNLFKVFVDNPSDFDNKIKLFQPQQPILIGKNDEIYKFEIIVNIMINYE